MRVLHVSSEYPPHKVFGLGRYVSDLARELAAQGHEVHVLTNSVGGTDQDHMDRGVYIHRVDYPPPPMPPTQAAPVAAFNLHLQQRAHALGGGGLGNPELLVSHDWLTAVAGHHVARRFGIPHVWTVHDTVHGKRFGLVTETEDRIAFAIERWATRTADLVLVNSIAVGDELSRIYAANPKRMDLLHPGLDVGAAARAQSEERLRMFRSILAGPTEHLVTFAGRLDSEKGVDTLINAFSIVCSQRADVRLAIAGRGVLQPIVEDHVRKLGLQDAVNLCGYLEGEVLRSFYRVGDVHVCPSHYEPFGLVALEAMAAGTPVVVSDTGGLRDIVSSTKVGRRVAPRDAEALAGTLLELLGSPSTRRQLAKAGSKHASERFGWPGLARRAAELYSRVLVPKEPVSV